MPKKTHIRLASCVHESSPKWSIVAMILDGSIQSMRTSESPSFPRIVSAPPAAPLPSLDQTNSSPPQEEWDKTGGPWSGSDEQEVPSTEENPDDSEVSVFERRHLRGSEVCVFERKHLHGFMGIFITASLTQTRRLSDHWALGPMDDYPLVRNCMPCDLFMLFYSRFFQTPPPTALELPKHHPDYNDPKNHIR